MKVTHFLEHLILLFHVGFSIDLTDFFNILPVAIEVEGNAIERIELGTRNDDITLEYDDTILLLFIPENSSLIEFYESEGEYIRDNVTVHIIDDDRKQTMIG